eukprot:RCo011765
MPSPSAPAYLRATAAVAIRGTAAAAEHRGTQNKGEKQRLQEVLAVARAETLLSSMELTEETYRSVRNKFEELDKVRVGFLTWDQLKGCTINGVSMLQGIFHRIDKDNRGKLEFHELLQGLFPRLPRYKLNHAIQKWGTPFCETLEGGESGPSWRDAYDDKQLREVQEIFELFCGGPGGSLTREQLREHVPAQDMPDHMFEEFFRQADLDGDNVLSLEEFATAMAEIYNSPHELVLAEQKSSRR